MRAVGRWPARQLAGARKGQLSRLPPPQLSLSPAGRSQLRLTVPGHPGHPRPSLAIPGHRDGQDTALTSSTAPPRAPGNWWTAHTQHLHQPVHRGTHPYTTSSPYRGEACTAVHSRCRGMFVQPTFLSLLSNCLKFNSPFHEGMSEEQDWNYRGKY